MIFWVAGIAINNLYIVAAIVVVVAALIYYRKRGKKDNIRYLF
jgi:hypothetical protein